MDVYNITRIDSFDVPVIVVVVVIFVFLCLVVPRSSFVAFYWKSWDRLMYKLGYAKLLESPWTYMNGLCLRETPKYQLSSSFGQFI